MAKAYIFDMNGTMIDDMHYHIQVWDKLLNEELKAGLSPEELRSHMYGKNEELITRVFGNRFSDEEMHKLSVRKEKMYQEIFLPHLKLIDGLPEFLEHAYKQGIPMAIATAAIPFNIDFVLDNLNIRHYFKAIISAHDVKESKPHPEVFLKAAQALNTAPEDCIVFEDAEPGVTAAKAAGMAWVRIDQL